MNGATAEPWVKTTRSPRSASITKIGPSHHFLRTLMKAHSSPIRPSFSRDSSNAMLRTSLPSVELEQRPPVHVLPQGGLLLLVQEVRAQDEMVHVGAHEAQVRVVRRADDGLATHVERRVDD